MSGSSGHSSRCDVTSGVVLRSDGAVSCLKRRQESSQSSTTAAEPSPGSEAQAASGVRAATKRERSDLNANVRFGVGPSSKVLRNEATLPPVGTRRWNRRRELLELTCSKLRPFVPSRLSLRPPSVRVPLSVSSCPPVSLPPDTYAHAQQLKHGRFFFFVT